MTEQETVSTTAAAKELGVSVRTVQNLLNDPASGLVGRRLTTIGRSRWRVYRWSLDEYKAKIGVK